MKKLEDFLMVNTLDSYEYSVMLFLSYLTRDLKDEKLQTLIAKKDLPELFDYMWKNHKSLFLNKDVRTVFERYLVVKKSELEELDILLNLHKMGIYVDLKDISLENIDLNGNCLTDEDNGIKIYNIESIIKQFIENNLANGKTGE